MAPSSNWGFEGGSPNSLIRHGVTKATIPTGTELIIQGYQSKAFEHKGVGVNMTFPDGTKIPLRRICSRSRERSSDSHEGRSRADNEGRLLVEEVTRSSRLEPYSATSRLDARRIVLK